MVQKQASEESRKKTLPGKKGMTGMLQDWQYYCFKLASRIVILFPYKFLLFCGELLGFIYYLAAKRQRERAMRQITERLGISRHEAEKIIKKMFVKIAQTFFEVLYMPKLAPNNINKYVEIKNRHYLDEALSKNCGAVYLTAHIGNWEWMGAAVAMNKYPLASIVKRQPNDQHTRLLNEYRRTAGIEVFASGSTELIAAAKALKKGKLVGFLSDQDAGVNGIFVEFLGKLASTPQGAAVFAKKFNAPIIPAFIARRPEGGHCVTIGQPIYYKETGDPDQDLYETVGEINRIIEAVIKENPEEWIWFLKRWNTPYMKGSGT